MRILQMSTESSVQVAFVLPLAEHLRKQGHEVVLACSNNPGEAGRSFVDVLRLCGFEVVIIPVRRRISPLWDLLALVRLYRYLRLHRFDLVHTQTAKAGMIGRMAARFAGVRAVVYTAHAFPFHENLSRIRIWCYAALERLAASWCDRIVVDTECVKARGLQFKIASENHFRVIPMGVDTERFNPEKYREQRAAIRLELGLKPDAFLVGAIARFVQGKGLEYLLRALAIITDRFQDTQCLLVGDGELRDELHRLAKSLGLDGRVVFAGYQRDTPRCLAAMDLFVLPTFREGFGVVFAEAMSMEVPVVGSRISPLTEIIVDGETGLLAEVGNVQAIAQATMSLVDDSDRCREMGRAGRRHVVANFSQAQMCLAYERIFLECLSRSLTGDLKGKAFSR